MADPWDAYTPINNAQAIQEPPAAQDLSDPWSNYQPISSPQQQMQQTNIPKNRQQPVSLAGIGGAFKQAYKNFNPFKSDEEIAAENRESTENEEGIGKTIGRYASQIAQTPIRLLGGALDIAPSVGIGAAEEAGAYPSRLDILMNPELGNIREEVKGEIPKNLAKIPSYHDIQKSVEKATGIPLEAKTKGQKAVAFASDIRKLAPGDFFQKLASGAASGTLKSLLMQADLKDPLTNIPIIFTSPINNPQGLKNILAGKRTPLQGEIESARKQLGLAPLPLTETTKSVPAKGLKEFVNYTGIGKEEFNRVIQNFDQSFVDNITGHLEKMSPREFMSSFEAGTELKALAKPGQKALTSRPEIYAPSPIFGQTQVIPRTRRITAGGQALGVTAPTQRAFHNPTNEYEQSLSQEQFQNDVQAGTLLVNQIRDSNEHHMNYFREYYDNIAHEATNVPARPDAQFSEDIKSMMTNLSGSYIRTNDEAKVLGTLLDLQGVAGQNIDISNATLGDFIRLGVVGADGRISGEALESLGLRPIRLDRLIKSIKSINSIMDYEVQGGFKKNLAQAKSAINGAINRFEDEAPNLVGIYRLINNEFQNYAEVYRSDIVEPFLNPTSRNYIELYGKAKKISNYNILGRILNENVEGSQLADALKREMFMDSIGDDLMNAQSTRDFETVLTRDNIRKLQNFRTTLNPGQIQQFDNYLAHISQRTPEIRNRISQIRQAPITEDQMQATVMKSLVDGDPEQIMRMLDSIENVKNFKAVLGATPQGKAIVDAALRFKLEQQFGDLALSVKQGRFKYSDFEKMIENKDAAAWIKEVGGQEYFNDLKNLQDLSFKISPEFKKESLSAKPSSERKLAIMYKWLRFGAEFTVDPLNAIKNVAYRTGGQIGREKIMQKFAQWMSDPKNIKDLNELAAANTARDFKKMQDIASRFESSI